MQENHKVTIAEHMTDAEIMRVIRYLDPDLNAERAEEDDGTALGICITFLTWLAGALTYICLYVRAL